MTSRKSIYIMGLIVSLLNLLGFSQKETNGQSQPPPPPIAVKKTVPFDKQLEVFTKLGFKLNPGISIDEVNRWGGREKFDDPPFMMLYITLGQTIEREPWTPLTDRVWDFDVEAVEDHGAYIEIMRNLERITRGEIKFENLKDFVDIEKGIAWVSFSCRGKNYKWNLEVDDDWADPALFTKIVELTKVLKTKGRYTYFNTGGQNAVIGFETSESREAIMKATGLKIEWLN